MGVSTVEQEHGQAFPGMFDRSDHVAFSCCCWLKRRLLIDLRGFLVNNGIDIALSKVDGHCGRGVRHEGSSRLATVRMIVQDDNSKVL